MENGWRARVAAGRAPAKTGALIRALRKSARSDKTERPFRTRLLTGGPVSHAKMLHTRRRKQRAKKVLQATLKQAKKMRNRTAKKAAAQKSP